MAALASLENCPLPCACCMLVRPVSHCALDLQEDLAGTLRQRMHLAVMDAEDGGSSEGPSLAAVLGASVQPLALALPKRVCFPLPVWPHLRLLPRWTACEAPHTHPR